MMRCPGLGLIAILLLGAPAQAKDVLPPTPARYFNDYAGVVTPPQANDFHQTLEVFEQQSSNQVRVVVFPALPEGEILEDYTARTFQAWGVGQKKLSNGVVLFVFVRDHKMRIEVGYGLEGALPDVLCKRILDNEITPHFKRGDYAAGLGAGIDAICKATRGEYKGAMPPVNPSFSTTHGSAPIPCLVFVGFFFVFIIVMIIRQGVRGVVFTSGGMSRHSSWGSFGGGSGGGWSSGGGGEGSFGGGGSCGGGGASGSW
jgi:uncharacterized protein